MARSFSLLAGSAAAAALAFAAPAPVRAGQEITSSLKESERMMQSLAECVVKSKARTPQVDRYLRTSPGDPTFRAQGQKLAVSECVPRSLGTTKMRFDPMLLRFSLFEARYRRAFEGSAPASLKDAPPLDLAREFGMPATDLPREITFLRALGNCVVRGDATDSHALVMSRLHSDQERAIVGQLKPMLAACVPADTTMRFSRTMLRGALAEALYKFQQQPALTKVAN